MTTPSRHSSGTGTRTLAEAVSHMTAEEKAAVKTIKVNSYITDLTGLEEFTNVETLDLTEAVSLQSFDLNGNSTVKSVDVSGNNGVKSLSLKGSKVEKLDASGCENLEEVDVSGCETLIILRVSDTPITKLDAEGCKNLEVLDCSYCNIVDLNITGCDSLNVLDCSNNSLAKLDAYTFTRLSELMCYNQQITGWKIGTEFNFMDYFQEDTSSSSEVSAAVPDYGIENIVNLKAWDANGGSVAVEYDVDTGTAKFSVAPAKIAYDYITGFNDVLMDVTVFTVEDWPPGAENRPGGCNTEFAVSVLVLGMFLTMFKKRE